MLKKKVPVYYFLIIIPLFSLAMYFGCYYYFNNKEVSDVAEFKSTAPTCGVTVKRLTDYKYIQPLVNYEKSCEAESLQPVRQEMEQTIENYKQSGVLSTASVYLRVFGQGDWVCINDAENYRPGSLLKVPELITFLRWNEKHPGYLNKVLTYSQPFISNKHTNFNSKSIELGKSYTIRELLKYMIEYSDNNATILLNNNMDAKEFKNTFTELGFKEPDMAASDYPINIKDYSLFFASLYNAGLLTIDDSEFAMELLSHSDFKDGLVGGLPDSASISHKFGEAGDDNMHELHECGIIYSGNKRYEITVMTKGKDFSKLSDVIKNISKIAYNKLNG